VAWQGLLWWVIVPLLVNLLIIIPSFIGTVIVVARLERGIPLQLIFASRAATLGALLAIPLGLLFAALTDLGGLGIGWSSSCAS
jgi:hypothetical protein